MGEASGTAQAGGEGALDRSDPASARATGSDADGATGPEAESSGRVDRTLLAGLTAFLLVATGLLARNRQLFLAPVYEVGDTAANSLLVLDAKALELLVGHYSRLGFHHPGPAILYLEALGEGLLTDLAGVTPAAHNGQLVALALLNAGVLAAVTAVLFSWTRSWLASALAVAAVLAWYASEQVPLVDAWTPLIAVPLFLLLLVATASVAAGRLRALWMLALVGGLLVHAHVAFALFVTVLALAALTALAVGARTGPRGLLRAAPRSWVAAAGIVALFLAPILLNTVLNWPGEVPKYLAHSAAGAGGQDLAAAVAYTLQFWPSLPGVALGLVPALLVLAAAATAVTAPPPTRRPLALLTATAVLAQALFTAYAYRGVDDLNQAYLGYFGWSIPAALLGVVAAAVGSHVTGLRLRRALGAAVGVGVALLSASPTFAADSGFSTGVPDLLRAVVTAAGGRPLLLDIDPGIHGFLDGSAVLLQAERQAVVACVLTRELSVQLTPERICSPAQRASGVVVQFRPPGTSPAPTARGYGDITVLP